MNTSSTSRRHGWVLALGAVVLLAIAAVSYFSHADKQRAPDVTFITLLGDKVPLQDLRGKVVMVNFWATSCTTCVKEMPEMVETYNKFKDKGLDFVAVAMSYDPPNYVLNYTQSRQLPFKVALDPQGTLAKSFGDVSMTPTTFLIAKDGTILKRYLGEPDFAALHKLLEKELAA